MHSGVCMHASIHVHTDTYICTHISNTCTHTYVHICNSCNIDTTDMYARSPRATGPSKSFFVYSFNLENFLLS